MLLITYYFRIFMFIFKMCVSVQNKLWDFVPYEGEWREGRLNITLYLKFLYSPHSENNSKNWHWINEEEEKRKESRLGHVNVALPHRMKAGNGCRTSAQVPCPASTVQEVAMGSCRINLVWASIPLTETFSFISTKSSDAV